MTTSVHLAPSGTRTGTIIAGVAGLLHVILAVIAPALTGELTQPSWSEPSASILDFYQTTAFDTSFMAGVFLEGVAFVVVLVLIAKLSDLVGNAEGGSPWLGRLIFGGAVLDTALILAYLSTLGAAGFRTSHGGMNADGYLLLNDLRFAFIWVGLLALVLWLASLGFAMIRTALFPRWLGWAMLVNSATILIAFFLPVRAWDITTGLPILWVLVIAVLLLTRPDRYSGRVSHS
ncbi:MAG TPA: hypothetical protein VEB69_05805 [Acidimicrobiia bacterium]|nr:hypothetical protein [Acidimicrobiia bacterium]